MDDTNKMSPQRCYLCNKKPSDNVTLHSFPKPVNVSAKWLYACGIRKVPDNLQHMRICSEHFCEQDYLHVSDNRKIKKMDAVPSIGVAFPNINSTESQLDASVDVSHFSTGAKIPVQMVIFDDEGNMISGTQHIEQKSAENSIIRKQARLLRYLQFESLLLNKHLPIDFSSKGDERTCRLCFSRTNKYTNLFHENGSSSSDNINTEKVIKIIETVMPIIDLSLSLNPVICPMCLCTLLTMYRYTCQTMNNQDNILQYMEAEQVSSVKLNLESVKKSPSWIHSKSMLNDSFNLSRSREKSNETAVENQEYGKVSEIRSEGVPLNLTKSTISVSSEENDNDVCIKQEHMTTEEESQELPQKEQELSQEEQEIDITYCNYEDFEQKAVLLDHHIFLEQYNPEDNTFNFEIIQPQYIKEEEDCAFLPYSRSYLSI